MTISWVAGSTTGVPTSRQAGDLIVVIATNPTSYGSLTVPSGWTELERRTAWDQSFETTEILVGYRIAAANTTTSRTAWGAGVFYVGVYRGVHQTSPIGAVATYRSNNNQPPTSTFYVGNSTLQYPGSSWVVSTMVTRPSATGIVPPWQWTHRGSAGGNRAHLLDTGGPVSNWNSTAGSLTPATNYINVAFEIRTALIPKSTTGSNSFALTSPEGTLSKGGMTHSPPTAAPEYTPIPFNGSFDADLSGWFLSFFGEPLGTGTRDTAFKRTGAASLKLQTTRDLGSGLWSGTAWYQVLTSAMKVPGARYRATAWVWLEPGVDQANISNWFDYDYPSAATTVTGQWVQLVAEGVPTRDVFDLAVECRASSSSGIVWVDDVTLELVAEPLSLALDVDATVVRSEGQIKPTSSSVDLAPFTLHGTLMKHGQVQATADLDFYEDLYGDLYGEIGIGLPLTLALAGATVKDTGINGLLPLVITPAGQPSKHVERDGTTTLRLDIQGAAFRDEENLTGLLTRLVAYEPNGQPLGVLPAPEGWNVTVPYGTEPGALTVAYPKNAPRSDLLMAPIEVALEVHDGHRFVEPTDCRWLVINRDHNENDPDSTISLGGVAMGLHLSKTIVADGPTDGETPGVRRFTSATAGRIMATLCAEAKSRGALVGVDVSTFNANTDSTGRPWSLVHSTGFDIGLPMSNVLEALEQLGMVEVRWDKRSLLLYDTESSSRDLTQSASPVIFHAGRDVRDAPVRSTIADLADTAIVRGDEGVMVEVTNPDLTGPWGRWETVLDRGGVRDLDDLEVVGTAELALSNVGRDEHTHALNFLGAKDLPFRSYRPGDWVGSIPFNSATRERYRLRQITLTLESDGVVSGSVILNDRIMEEDVKVRKRMNGVQGGASNSAPRPRPTEGDNTTPNAPTNLAGTTSVFMDGKNPVAEVFLTWRDPTHNTDGTPIDDLNQVQVWAKPNRAGTSWRFLTSARAGAQQVSYSPLEPSQTYSFRVTAIDYTGHTSGDSNTITINLASDLTPPPTPSAPDTGSRNGVVEISFSGKTNTGADMPRDFSHVEVYAHTGSSVPTTASYRVGTIAADASSLTLTDWPYTRPLYARLIAVDVSGNKSSPSPVSAATVNDQIGQGDIANNAVGAGALNVAAIDSAGNLNVNQLTGKTITGVTINGGLFRSTNTSQRVEIGDTGPNDPVDEIRMFNGGTVSSIRNPSDRVGALRLNASNTIWNLYREDDGHPVMHSSGRGMLKWMTSANGLQARTANDAGYAPMAASAFNVASERAFKNDITPASLDATAAVKATRAKRWNWKWNAGTDDASKTELGLIADELPEDVRSGDGYSVTAVVALLWNALREAHERIDRLENP